MKKIRSIIFGVLCVFMLAHNSFSQNTEWTVNSATVKFKIKNAGFIVDGAFTGLTAKISFDETKSYGNFIEATVDSKSINTGNGSRDGHLKKAEYFDVEKYPKITMKATVFSKEKDGTYKGYFKITMKDKSKDLFVPFTFSEKDGKTNFKGSFTINRLDFTVGESSMILSNNVTLFLEVNAIKK